MVRPRRRGNRRLCLPGLSANPRPPRTRACGYSGSNPASALRSRTSLRPRHQVTRPSSICFLCQLSVSVFVIPLRVPFLSPTCESLYCASFIYSPPSYVTRLFVLRVDSSICFYVRHSVARPLSISYSYVMSCASFTCLSCASFIYLFPMFVIHLRVPFYLLLVSHCIARPLSVCLARLSVLW
jgi:hypothetical protein